MKNIKNLSGFVSNMSKYEKMWLWWYAWGDTPANVGWGDCDD